MDNNQNPKEFHLYSDIRERTGGEIYIGVVGPVRTGKSTFIKRFMDLMVLPNMEDIHERERATDELPQSAAGKTIMTTEPKFVPKEAAQIELIQTHLLQPESSHPAECIPLCHPPFSLPYLQPSLSYSGHP